MSDPEPELAALIDDLPVVVWQAGSRAVTFMSSSVQRLLGHPAQRWLDDPGFWREITHPEDRETSESLRWNSDTDYETVYRVFTAAGGLLWLREKVRVHGAQRSGVLIDVTARHAAEQRQRFLDLLEVESQRLDRAEDLMALATRLLGEHMHVDRCAYARTEADENHFVMSGDHATGLPPLPGRFAMREFGNGALAAMRAGVPWVVVDSLNDERLDAEDLAAYRATGIRAVICLPLLRGGRFVAAMAVHQATVREWTPEEIDLVSVVVNRCWESMQRAHSDRALRDSEHLYRQLVERATDAIWLLDHDLRFVAANPATGDLLGYEPGQLLGTPLSDVVVDLPADLSTSQVVTMRRADGTQIALELSIQQTPTGVQAIGRDVTERQRAEAERELLLQREHEIAAALQEGLLPRELPTLTRLATAARYLPAAQHSQIGGDWYEVVPIGATRVGLAVGDVVGKGPAAAAVMGQLRSALTSYLLDGHSPAESLRRLDTFATRVNGAAGSTCTCMIFDWSTGELCWAAAGHPPPVVIDESGARLLTATAGPVLGAGGPALPGQHSAPFPPGASVVLYTDGLVERRDEVVDKGLHRLSNAVNDKSALGPAALAQQIIKAMLTEGQSDDVALVVARHLPTPLRRHLPAVSNELSALRRAASSWAGVAGFSEDTVYDLELAIGEAAANVVDHAYPAGGGTFDAVLECTGRGVRVTVSDRGSWRPQPEDTGFRGRGLTLIRAMSDEVDLEAGDNGTTIRFHIPAVADTPASTPPAPRSAPAVVSGLTDGVDEQVQAILLTGDLDIATIDELRHPLFSRIEADDDRPVEVDLTGLDYLSSSGVALLLQAMGCAKECGRVMSLVARRNSAPARILDLAGLAHTAR